MALETKLYCRSSAYFFPFLPENFTIKISFHSNKVLISNNNVLSICWLAPIWKKIKSICFAQWIVQELHSKFNKALSAICCSNHTNWIEFDLCLLAWQDPLRLCCISHSGRSAWTFPRSILLLKTNGSPAGRCHKASRQVCSSANLSTAEEAPAV